MKHDFRQPRDEPSSDESMTGDRSARPRPAIGRLACGVGLGVITCLGLVPPLAADWTSADDRFASYLIRELEYFDTAARWLEEKSRERGIDERARAEIDARRLDILRGQGDDQGFARALEKFQRNYPWHRRASVGSLEEIGEELGRVLATLERAAVAEEDDAGPLRQAAKKGFADVIASLDGLIDEHAQTLAKLEVQLKDVDDLFSSDEYRTRLVARDQARLARVRFYLNYGRRYPEGSAERKEALERALELADDFIDSGTDFYVIEYDAQLNRGIIAYELGRYLLARDHLGVLYDILPPSAPPYPPFVVTAIRDVRLQAILYGTRALSAAGEFREASRVIKEHLLTARKDDPFDLSRAEEEDLLRKYAVLAKLEYAVALAGDGDSETALKSIHAVIDRYEGSEKDEDRAYVTDARKALGRLALIKGVSLRGQDYYQAARGLKSEFKFEAALTTFQQALASLTPREFVEYAPLCLGEIGENLVLLGRYAESAVAYAELFESFDRYLGSSEVASRASKNFLHATTKAIETTPGGSTHSRWRALGDLATKQYEQHAGSGLGATQALMVQAGQLEREGNFETARETYLKVPAQVERDGEKIVVPFYWRAQANAEAMVFELWRRAGPAEASNPWTEAIGSATARLGEILKEAIGKDDDGAATAALTLGQIHFLNEEWAAAEAALRVFASGLKDLEDYRCAGVGYLALSLSRQDKCDEAARLLEDIRKECGSSPVLGYAALNLSDCFQAAGDPRFAARYVLIYAVHSGSREDLESIDTLLMVTSRLAEGASQSDGSTTAFLKGAKKFAAMAREHADAKAEEYRRQLALIDARVHRAEGDEKKAIAVLDEYIREFKPYLGVNPEDPQVYYDLAEIYWARRRGGGRSGPTVKDAQSAEKNYESACALLEGRMRADPAVEATFWRWALRLMEVRFYLGESGSTESYGQIINFVERRLASDMGGLKAEFEKILQAAKEKKAERSR